ncbi:MAG TPA: hypothetical protein PKO06_04345 [Candidatus Ozemobacteraceae bacterium]|nr:hypothetical protein [Candidatus Ozemobacteraceae bacterium]
MTKTATVPTPVPAGTMPPMICLTGIDGCGKSTHLRTLTERLQQHLGEQIPVLSVWDISRLPRYRAHPLIADRETLYQYLGSLHGGARGLFILHALRESLDNILDAHPRLILVDGYWYKYLLTEILHDPGCEWLYDCAVAFPRPIGTVLLDLPAEASFQRKPALTPYECGFARPGPDTFIPFQNRLRAALQEMARRERWPVIDADRPVFAVAEQIWTQVEKWL